MDNRTEQFLLFNGSANGQSQQSLSSKITNSIASIFNANAVARSTGSISNLLSSNSTSSTSSGSTRFNFTTRAGGSTRFSFSPIRGGGSRFGSLFGSSFGNSSVVKQEDSLRNIIKIKKAIKMFDFNKNGRVDDEEVIQYMLSARSKGHEIRSEIFLVNNNAEKIHEVIDTIDTEYDGEFSDQEMVEFALERLKENGLAQDLDESFVEHFLKFNENYDDIHSAVLDVDLDQDGEISNQEVIDKLIGSQNLDNEFVDHVLKTNANFIGLSEFIKEYNLGDGLDDMDVVDILVANRQGRFPLDRSGLDFVLKNNTSSKKIEELFNAFDSNEDAVVSDFDYVHGLFELNKRDFQVSNQVLERIFSMNSNTEELDEIVALIDRDADGEVSLDDQVNLFMSISRGELDHLNESKVQLVMNVAKTNLEIERLKRVLELIDANTDGNVDDAELVNARLEDRSGNSDFNVINDELLEAFFRTNENNEEIRAAVEIVDKTGDGHIGDLDVYRTLLDFDLNNQAFVDQVLDLNQDLLNLIEFTQKYNTNIGISEEDVLDIILENRSKPSPYDLDFIDFVLSHNTNTDKVKDLVIAFDIDADGLISDQDLLNGELEFRKGKLDHINANLLEKVRSMNVNRERVNEALSEIDKDATGEVSAYETLSLLMRTNKGELDHLDKASVDLIINYTGARINYEKFKAALEKFDPDNNGIIDDNELIDLFLAKFRNEIKQEDIDLFEQFIEFNENKNQILEAVKEVDLDTDGFISDYEVLDLFINSNKSGQYIDMVLERSANLDKLNQFIDRYDLRNGINDSKVLDMIIDKRKGDFFASSDTFNFVADNYNNFSEISRVLNNFDAGKNGVISNIDLVQGLVKLRNGQFSTEASELVELISNLNPQKQGLIDALDQIDVDSNGLIDNLELVDTILKLDRSELGHLNPALLDDTLHALELDSKIERIRSLISDIDIDGDLQFSDAEMIATFLKQRQGLISDDDFEIIELILGSHENKEAIENAVDSIDSSKNGLISDLEVLDALFNSKDINENLALEVLKFNDNLAEIEHLVDRYSLRASVSDQAILDINLNLRDQSLELDDDLLAYIESKNINAKAIRDILDIYDSDADGIVSDRNFIEGLWFQRQGLADELPQSLIDFVTGINLNKPKIIEIFDILDSETPLGEISDIELLATLLTQDRGGFDHIDSEILDTVFEVTAVKPRVQEIREIIALIDKNTDGLFSDDELVEALLDHPQIKDLEPVILSFLLDQNENGQQILEAVTIVDADGNDIVSKLETLEALMERKAELNPFVTLVLSKLDSTDEMQKIIDDYNLADGVDNQDILDLKIALRKRDLELMGDLRNYIFAKNANSQFIEESLNIYDADRDGYISDRNFVEGMWSERKGMGLDIPEDIKAMVRGSYANQNIVEEVFESLDPDANGEVTIREMLQTIVNENKGEFSHINPAIVDLVKEVTGTKEKLLELEAILVLIDRNLDGNFDDGEMVNGLIAHPEIFNQDELVLDFIFEQNPNSNEILGAINLVDHDGDKNISNLNVLEALLENKGDVNAFVEMVLETNDNLNHIEDFISDFNFSDGISDSELVDYIFNARLSNNVLGETNYFYAQNFYDYILTRNDNAVLIEEAFQIFDPDEDGTVSNTNYIEGLWSIKQGKGQNLSDEIINLVAGTNLNKEKIKAVLDSLDPEANGKVENKDLYKTVTQLYSQGFNLASSILDEIFTVAGVKDSVAKLTSVAELVDINKDGDYRDIELIDALLLNPELRDYDAEIGAFLEFYNSNLASITRAVKDIDKDKDSQISNFELIDSLFDLDLDSNHYYKTLLEENQLSQDFYSLFTDYSLFDGLDKTEVLELLIDDRNKSLDIDEHNLNYILERNASSNEIKSLLDIFDPNFDGDVSDTELIEALFDESLSNFANENIDLVGNLNVNYQALRDLILELDPDNNGLMEEDHVYDLAISLYRGELNFDISLIQGVFDYKDFDLNIEALLADFSIVDKNSNKLADDKEVLDSYLALQAGRFDDTNKPYIDRFLKENEKAYLYASFVDKADVNKDGDITRQELIDLVDIIDKNYWKDASVNPRADVDANGRIDSGDKFVSLDAYRTYAYEKPIWIEFDENRILTSTEIQETETELLDVLKFDSIFKFHRDREKYTIQALLAVRRGEFSDSEAAMHYLQNLYGGTDYLIKRLSIYDQDADGVIQFSDFERVMDFMKSNQGAELAYDLGYDFDFDLNDDNKLDEWYISESRFYDKIARPDATWIELDHRKDISHEEYEDARAVVGSYDRGKASPKAIIRSLLDLRNGTIASDKKEAVMKYIDDLYAASHDGIRNLTNIVRALKLLDSDEDGVINREDYARAVADIRSHQGDALYNAKGGYRFDLDLSGNGYIGRTGYPNDESMLYTIFAPAYREDIEWINYDKDQVVSSEQYNAALDLVKSYSDYNQVDEKASILSLLAMRRGELDDIPAVMQVLENRFNEDLDKHIRGLSLMDENKDGDIDFEEYASAWAKFDANGSEVYWQMNPYFDFSLDINENAHINLHKDGDRGLMARYYDHYARPEIKWVEALNEDAIVTSAELNQARDIVMGYSISSQVDERTSVQALLAMRRGEISNDKFDAVMKVIQSSLGERDLDTLIKSLDLMDSNKDGNISTEEFEKQIVKYGGYHDQRETLNFDYALDVDSSKTIWVTDASQVAKAYDYATRDIPSFLKAGEEWKVLQGTPEYNYARDFIMQFSTDQHPNSYSMFNSLLAVRRGEFDPSYQDALVSVIVKENANHMQVLRAVDLLDEDKDGIINQADFVDVYKRIQASHDMRLDDDLGFDLNLDTNGDRVIGTWHDTHALTQFYKNYMQAEISWTGFDFTKHISQNDVHEANRMINDQGAYREDYKTKALRALMGLRSGQLDEHYTEAIVRNVVNYHWMGKSYIRAVEALDQDNDGKVSQEDFLRAYNYIKENDGATIHGSINFDYRYAIDGDSDISLRRDGALLIDVYNKLNTKPISWAGYEFKEDVSYALFDEVRAYMKDNGYGSSSNNNVDLATTARVLMSVKNGTFPVEYIPTLSLVLGFSNMSIAINSIFLLDLDGDGIISLEELNAAKALMHSYNQAHVTQNPDFPFELDLNNNGYISDQSELVWLDEVYNALV